MRRNTAAIGLMLAALLAGSADAVSTEKAPELLADDCIQELLKRSIEGFRRLEARLRVEVTILGGGCELTVQVLVLQTPDEQIAVEALIADHDLVLQQIIRLRHQSPDEPLTGLCNSVMLQEVELPDREVSSVAGLMSDLRELQIAAVPEPMLVIHGVS